MSSRPDAKWYTLCFYVLFAPNAKTTGGARMKRIGVLTAGGDTPALNATIQGVVMRSNQRKVEVTGFIKGFSSLLNPRVPHVRLNPLFTTIPELDPTRGGTLIGASRDYVDPDDRGHDSGSGRSHGSGCRSRG